MKHNHKFFIDQITQDETEQVLFWYDTSSIVHYLRKRLNMDYNLMDRNKLQRFVPELDSDNLYEAIQIKIEE